MSQNSFLSTLHFQPEEIDSEVSKLVSLLSFIDNFIEDFLLSSEFNLLFSDHYHEPPNSSLCKFINSQAKKRGILECHRGYIIRKFKSKHLCSISSAS